MTDPAMVVVLEARVPEGGRPALEEFLTDAQPVYERDGIRMRVQWDHANPTHVREIFEYPSVEVFEQDQERVAHDPELRALLARWHALLAQQPAVSIWEPSERWP